MKEQSMQNPPSLLTRDDTFFGVCEGLGRDLGFHPNLLRVALAGLLFWSPVIALSVYAAAGAIVAVSRWLFPDVRVAVPAEAEAAVAPALTPSEEMEVPLAA
jgi:phage shock protein PspC (stress-responsive transcriptional regulator)